MPRMNLSIKQIIKANIMFSILSGAIGSAFSYFLFYEPPTPNKNFKSYYNDKDGRLIGVGEYKYGVWREYITFKKKSRLNKIEGESAIVIHNKNNKRKTFELGFYNYGPTLATNNEIVEFYIGNVDTGAQYSALSVRSLNAPFGGSLQIRNHADTSAIFINNHKPNSINYHVTLKETPNVNQVITNPGDYKLLD